jgi:polyhydroxyalkanoate synthesis regulator phasin
MEIKFFNTIDEWVKSNPDQETITKVLTMVNKRVITDIKKRIREKNSEIKKMEKMVNAMKDVGFPIDNSVLKKITNTRNEVTELEKQLPAKQ